MVIIETQFKNGERGDNISEKYCIYYIPSPNELLKMHVIKESKP